MCLSAILSLFGCGKGNILDGDGMENVPKWEKMELSRSDSYAQHIFWFDVEMVNGEMLVTGECRDDDGNELALEKPVKLKHKDYNYMISLKLDELPDVKETSIEDFDEELIILDAPSITLTLTYADGSKVKKCGADNVSIEIYHRLLPYFK